MNVMNLNVSGFRTNYIANMRISKISNESRIRAVRLSPSELTEGCRVGIDSHADTSCAGKHVRITEYVDGKLFSVSPFNEKYKPLENVRMINGIMAVDREDGSGLIIELNNFLDFTDSMTDTILVPMQSRMNGVIVNDTPRLLCPYGKSTQ